MFKKIGGLDTTRFLKYVWLSFIIMHEPVKKKPKSNGSRYQEWTKQDLWKTAFKKFEVIWSAYYLKFPKGCIPQILLSRFLNTLVQMLLYLILDWINYSLHWIGIQKLYLLSIDSFRVNVGESSDIVMI